MVNENIVIDITKTAVDDFAELYHQLATKLTNEEILRTVVVHTENAALSKNGTELLKFLKG